MKKIGIIGGAGYTAGELIRLLVNHPQVKIEFIQSNSQSEKSVTSVHKDLVGEIELNFVAEADYNVDVLFLCMGHGKSKEFLDQASIPKDVVIIDLSTDFRHKSSRQSFVYGLPELNRNEISEAKHIANPGCFATCIQLALLPIANAGLLTNDVHVHAITGSTGAGVGLSPTTHFSWRNNNVSIYKPFEHQHLTEIKESLEQSSGGSIPEINFIPVRGNFTRGIFASVYTSYTGNEDEAISLFESFYEQHPFVHITTEGLSLKQVVNTNKCLIQVQVIDGKLLITATIDNLLKGASGQAIQNMNILSGWDEKMGLNLKSTSF